jgi:hypothetical protein
MGVVAVLSVVAVDESSATCDVKCFEGILMVGDRVAVENDPAHAAEVESIQRYENVYVDELEPNFGARLYLTRPIPPGIRAGCKLITLAN